MDYNSISMGVKYEMFSSQQEDVKFHAFFQYMRSFSETGLATLNKLESDFNREMRKRLNQHQILAVYKNILSAYEIFALQMKDSCDFVELSEFGACISKTFLQLIKIIKWFIRSWIKNTGQEKKIEAQRIHKSSENGALLCSFCEEVIKAGNVGRDARGKRKGVAIDIESDIRQAKSEHRKETNHLYELKSQVLDRCTQKELESRRFIQDEMDLLNRKHVALKMEISNNETVLEEILNQFSVKTEAIARFLTTTQVNCFEDFQLTRDQEYHSFEEQMKKVIETSHQHATIKLRQIIINKLTQLQLDKRSKQEELGVQTQVLPDFEKERMEMKMKHLTGQTIRLRRQLQEERQLVESLKVMLANKSVQFQEEFTKYRKEVFGEKRRQDMLKSIKNFADIEEQEHEEEAKPNRGSIVFDKLESSQSIKPLFKKVVNGPRQGRSRKQVESFGQQQMEELSRVKPVQPIPPIVSIQATITQTDYGVQHETLGVNTDISWEELLRLATGSAKPSSAKPRRTELYSHISSRVYNSVPKQNVPEPPKKVPQPTHIKSSNSFSLVRKLAPQACSPRPSQQVTCHPLVAQPRYSLPTSGLMIGKQDIKNLFINDQNAQSYEFMFYRHCFSPASLNPRRKVDMARRSQMDPLVSDNTDGRVVRALFKQLETLRRREKEGYQQLKVLFRSPWELSQKLDVLHLQGLGNDKDIELPELNRMMGLVMRFHSECVGCQKDVVCCHISDFTSRIGLSLI